MPIVTASEEAAAILTRVLEALARQNGKTLSQKTRADVARACELLATGDSYDELLDDLLSAPPPIRSERVTQSFERERIPTEDEQIRRFQTWQAERRWEDVR